MKTLPIYDNRTIVGHARSIAHAKKVLARMITIPQGFTLLVWQRSDHICEILELPQGYVFSIAR